MPSDIDQLSKPECLAARIVTIRLRREAQERAEAARRELAVATLAVFIALGLHIFLGGEFEMRTVGAMIIRSSVWVVIAASACRAFGSFQRGMSGPP